jgi:hypothetical protein
LPLLSASGAMGPCSLVDPVPRSTDQTRLRPSPRGAAPLQISSCASASQAYAPAEHGHPASYWGSRHPDALIAKVAAQVAGGAQIHLATFKQRRQGELDFDHREQARRRLRLSGRFAPFSVEPNRDSLRMRCQRQSAASASGSENKRAVIGPSPKGEIRGGANGSRGRPSMARSTLGDVDAGGLLDPSTNGVAKLDHRARPAAPAAFAPAPDPPCFSLLAQIALFLLLSP